MLSNQTFYWGVCVFAPPPSRNKRQREWKVEGAACWARLCWCFGDVWWQTRLVWREGNENPNLTRTNASPSYLCVMTATPPAVTKRLFSANTQFVRRIRTCISQPDDAAPRWTLLSHSKEGRGWGRAPLVGCVSWLTCGAAGNEAKTSC